MTDLIALAKQAGDVETDSRGRETFSFDSYGLQAFADLIRKESEAERDRLREALKQACANFKQVGFLCEPHGMHRHEISKAMDAIKQALEAKP